jgi:hypothetical protein
MADARPKCRPRHDNGPPAIVADAGLLTDALLSHIVRLRLTYGGAAKGAPASLILKAAMPGRAPSKCSKQHNTRAPTKTRG